MHYLADKKSRGSICVTCVTLQGGVLIGHTVQDGRDREIQTAERKKERERERGGGGGGV